MRRIASFLARQCAVPTPFLFFDEGEILKSLSYFERHLPEVRLFYAMKANPHPLLLRYFAQRGLSFDVSSAQEVTVVSQMGLSGSRMIFTNPIKGTKCLHSLFAHGVRGYTVDTVVELEKIAEFKRRHGYATNPELYLRIRVESKGVQIDLNEKFGCALEDAPALIARADHLGLRPVGLAFHVGTQSYLAENFEAAIRSSMLIAKTVQKECGVNLSMIDIGGGFPDAVLATKEGPGLERLFSELGRMCRNAIRAGFILLAEPGRLLVGSAGCLLTSVIGLANRNGRRWLYLDDGIYGCYSGRMFDHQRFRFHPIAGMERCSPFSPEVVPFVVGGPTCDSIDLVEESALLPANITVGDYVCSTNMGAYSLATACNFNGFNLAASAFVSQAHADLPRKVTVLGRALWRHDDLPRPTVTELPSDAEDSGAYTYHPSHEMFDID